MFLGQICLLLSVVPIMWAMEALEADDRIGTLVFGISAASLLRPVATALCGGTDPTAAFVVLDALGTIFLMVRALQALDDRLPRWGFAYLVVSGAYFAFACWDVAALVSGGAP